MSDLWRLSASELAQAFAGGRCTPVDVLEACLERTAQCQPHLSAMLHVDMAAARMAAETSALRWSRGQPLGPLDGVPVSLQDNLHAAGQPTTWGSLLLRDWVATGDELPVARLRAGGAVLFGKTNLPEFALQGYTGNLLAGVARNPWNLELTPGGSCGGAAAAVAAGCGPLALATDGGGSIRRPASHCGLVGFKPGAGQVPRGGGLPEIFLEHEAVGAIGRTVADVRLLFQAVSGSGSNDQGPAPAPSRILYVPRFADHPVDPGIAQRVHEAARQFEALGHAVDEASRFELSEPLNAQWSLLPACGLAWMLGDADRFPEFGLGAGELPDIVQCTPAIQQVLEQGLAAEGAALFELLATIHELRRKLQPLFASHDFLLTPATAALPWPADQTHPVQIAGQSVGPRGHAVFSALANAAGLPAAAVPCGFVRGLPTGFQLVGRPGADAAVLALAQQYEEAHPWARHWPPTAAAGPAGPASLSPAA
ncbi:amidase [Caenimonas terrae]|uniref:Amidase n=1 Tax=Caenimonas terrae TaxID=696074 RepID=A0ABW0NDI4_9BURK